VTSVTAPISGARGNQIAELTVATLPGRSDRLERDGDRIVLEEEGSYRFVITWQSEDSLVIEPSGELFNFDDESKMTGRLLPKQHVGRIRVAVRRGDTSGEFVLSIEPKKLSAETEYHQMLDDIAEVAVEAILQGFAPAAAALTHQPDSSPKLLYQQFAFIHARLASTGTADLALIVSQPHRDWVDREELRPPGMPLRGGSRNLRALSRPGATVPAPASFALSRVPARLAVAVTNETVDTEANRFVKFALERWRIIAIDIRDRLLVQGRATGPMSRGIDAAEEVIEIVDRALNSPMFRDLGRLSAFPTANTVLQKRAGYREIFRTFVLAETGARLALDWDIEDVFSASQRNVATLYEYWTFLQLISAVGEVCGEDLMANSLVPSSDGLSLGFPRGASSRLKWTTTAGGRVMTLELFFNRSFLVSERADSSWTRAMRPDCSLLIRPAGALGTVSADDLSIWLHFDAKYKVERLRDQFAKPSPDDELVAAEAEETERLTQSKRNDLLKMHAYRDAIRRSAGAYVLYPGAGNDPPFTERTEILPGLGAFPLKPAAGRAAGLRQLEAFLRNVIDHAADRATEHERSRYWSTIIHRPGEAVTVTGREFPNLGAPPRDVQVLCGFVKDDAHYQWIKRTALYNVRAGNRRGAGGADGSALQPLDIVLYGPATAPELCRRSGAWFVQGRAELRELNYPEPRGETYLVCPLQFGNTQPEWLKAIDVATLASSAVVRGTPFTASWSALVSTR
jgi:uncharacterized protein